MQSLLLPRLLDRFAITPHLKLQCLTLRRYWLHKGKVDPLSGLKENVIIGKLIPAGTGLPEVREDLKRREQERDEAVAAEMAAANQQ